MHKYQRRLQLACVADENFPVNKLHVANRGIYVASATQAMAIDNVRGIQNII